MARPTALGNPFFIGKPYARAESLARYRVWLLERIASGDPKVLAQLERIVAAARAGEVTLLCWCSPLPCHAEIISQEVRLRLTGG